MMVRLERGGDVVDVKNEGGGDGIYAAYLAAFIGTRGGIR